jgi:hypothetical protein
LGVEVTARGDREALLVGVGHLRGGLLRGMVAPGGCRNAGWSCRSPIALPDAPRRRQRRREVPLHPHAHVHYYLATNMVE